MSEKLIRNDYTYLTTCLLKYLHKNHEKEPWQKWIPSFAKKVKGSWHVCQRKLGFKKCFVPRKYREQRDT
jgi:hypothetical protein